jgi:hypothetical protein
MAVFLIAVHLSTGSMQAMKLAISAAQQESGDSLDGARTASAPMFAHYRVLQAPGSRS